MVTGGANGIGRAAAEALAGAEPRSGVFDLPREDPEAAAAQFGARGIVADVTSPESLAAAFARVGAPDIVVANAGTAFVAGLTEATADEWERTLAVNLGGVFHTVRLAARVMKPRRRGAIVLTASTNCFDGEAGLTAYNASKAGLLGILHTAANELGPYGIRVNAVCPGLIRTRLASLFLQAGGA